MFQITSDYQHENISDRCVFQIGFRLVSHWFQIGTKNLRLCLQISDCFRLLSESFQTGLKNHKTSDFVFAFQIASDWPEPQQRSRTVTLTQLMLRRRICDELTWNRGRRMRLPTWKYGWRLRRRRTILPRGE